MPRPLFGNRNEASDLGAPQGCKGHTLFIVSFLFFSTVLSDLYPVSLSAIPGPSGERTVRIREVRGFDPLQVHQNESTRLGAFRFGLKGIESCPYSPVGCTLASSKTGQPLYSLFAKRKENAVIPFESTI